MAVTIPQNVILIWAGSVATIPTGWARVTSLDGKFPKGTADATDPNDTGGAATHSHNATANHSHTMAAHSHTVTLSNVASFSSNQTDSNGTEGVPGQHSHQFSLGGVSGGALSSVAATYASVSNNPPYHEVIYITPSGATGDLLDGIITLWNQASVPSGFTFCDGSGGTPDLRNKYLRGAAASQNAGATGGSTQNVHNLTHTHTESGHTHSGTSSGITDTGGKRGTGGSGRLSRGHTHPVSLQSATAGSISSVQLTTAETVEPAYHKLMAIENTSGGGLRPQSIIALWLGALGSIPAGWRLCDGNDETPDLRGKYVKIANDSGELGTTGGSNTHTHASQAHSHTGGSHSHAGNNTDDHWSKNTISGVGGSQDLQDGGSAHSVTNVASASAAWNSANTAADSASNEPEYRTVAYIMLTGTQTNSERSGEVTGQIASNDERSAEITGVLPASERSAETHGKEQATSERSAEISGKLVWTPESKPDTPDWDPEEKLTT